MKRPQSALVPSSEDRPMKVADRLLLELIEGIEDPTRANGAVALRVVQLAKEYFAAKRTAPEKEEA